MENSHDSNSTASGSGKPSPSLRVSSEPRAKTGGDDPEQPGGKRKRAAVDSEAGPPKPLPTGLVPEQQQATLEVDAKILVVKARSNSDSDSATGSSYDSADRRRANDGESVADMSSIDPATDPAMTTGARVFVRVNNEPKGADPRRSPRTGTILYSESAAVNGSIQSYTEPPPAGGFWVVKMDDSTTKKRNKKYYPANLSVMSPLAASVMKPAEAAEAAEASDPATDPAMTTGARVFVRVNNEPKGADPRRSPRTGTILYSESAAVNGSIQSYTEPPPAGGFWVVKMDDSTTKKRNKKYYPANLSVMSPLAASVMKPAEAAEASDKDKDTTAACSTCGESDTLRMCEVKAQGGSYDEDEEHCEIALCQECFANGDHDWPICPSDPCRDPVLLCGPCHSKYVDLPMFTCMECEVSTSYCCIDNMTACKGKGRKPCVHGWRESMCYKCSEEGGGLCSGCQASDAL